MINRVVSDDELDSSAIDLATTLAAGPTRTFAHIRDLAWTAADCDLPSVLAAERFAQRDVGMSNDAAEGFSAFLQKRRPIFTGS